MTSSAAYRQQTRRAARAMVVGVPVRNEARRLPSFLAALAALEGAETMTLCIAFDGCDDDSAGIVAAARAVLPFDIVSVALERGAPNAGRARRAAIALAAAQGDEDAILISTDADSWPQTDWLTTTIAALNVADIAAGRIVRDAEHPSPAQDRVEAYFDGLFALRRSIDPVPWEAAATHHYTSGASLAFRAGVYRALGGFEPLPSGEDARMIDAAHAAGYRVRRDAAIRVTTSSRRQGRATDGLADHLRRLDGGAIEAMMAHPADAAWRYRQHAAARAVWGEAGRYDALAAQLGCPIDDVRRVAATSINAEAFAMRVGPEIPGGERQVTLDVAEQVLAALVDRRVAA